MTALASDAINLRPAYQRGLGNPAANPAHTSPFAPGRVRSAVVVSEPGPRRVDQRRTDLARPTLSGREVEVLLAWLAAESKEEAAANLFISASTVSTHISRIRAKYAAVGRVAPTKTHLLARALQDGFTTLEDW